MLKFLSYAQLGGCVGGTHLVYCAKFSEVKNETVKILRRKFKVRMSR